jgi:hypothetical protein
MPSGLIIQWGSTTTSAAGDVAVTFPVAFPSQCRSVTATQNNSTTGGVFTTTNTRTTTGFNVAGWSNTSTRSAVGVDWIAFGY